MKKIKLLPIVNSLLAVLFLVQLSSIIAIKAFHVHGLGELHEYNGMAFNALVFVHLWLNRAWIKQNIFKKK